MGEPMGCILRGVRRPSQLFDGSCNSGGSPHSAPPGFAAQSGCGTSSSGSGGRGSGAHQNAKSAGYVYGQDCGYGLDNSWSTNGWWGSTWQSSQDPNAQAAGGNAPPQPHDRQKSSRGGSNLSANAEVFVPGQQVAKNWDGIFQ